MSDRSIEDFDHINFYAGSAGDVVAARRLAKQLLSVALAPPKLDDLVLATLILTAACLHAGSVHGYETGAAHVAECLEALLGADGSDQTFLRSPMQFVRYAALELRSLPADDRASLVHQLVGTLMAPPTAG